MATPIALIVGLGNPGTEYRDTRHNVGFQFLDRLAQAQRLNFSAQAKFFGQTARLHTASGDVWLLKPTTYMNLSGAAVQALASYYKIAPEAILVVHDELDLDPGAMKVKLGGGHAGHNGLKDITQKLSSPNFWRLRVGIGHPRRFCPKQAVADWVLGCPESAHQEAIDACIEAALKTLEAFSAGQFDRVKRAIAPFASVPANKKEVAA